MTEKHDIKNAEHLDICFECRQSEARRCAVKIANAIVEIMRPTLESCPIKDEYSFFQGEVCQLVSAFMLCHSLRILKDNNVSIKLQEIMLEKTIEIAELFEEEAVFYRKGETH